MIASWMLYALMIGALLTVAALATERVLTARGKPTRFVWVASLALSIGWPLAPAVARLLPAPAKPVRVMPFTIVVDVGPAVPAGLDYATLIDRGLIAAWATLSIFLALRLLRGVSAVERSRGAWKRGRVNGVRVKLSDNVGPAVVGLRSMEVVLPEWIMTLDENLRAIVLRHEEEHRLARDPYLLFGAAIAVAVMPWNLALWFQARRLRLAIEMDCDDRVLRAHPSPERYGMLILTIAQRRSMSPALFAPMLTEPTTNLERRIIKMKNRTKRVARATVIGGSVVAAGVLAFASSLQSAGRYIPKPTMPKAIVAAANRVVPRIVPETIPVKKKSVTERPVEVRRLDSVVVSERSANPTPRYPAMLRSANIEGAVLVRYNTDDRGNVDISSINVVRSTHPLFTESVLSNMKNWHAAPNATLETPFVFTLSGKTGAELQPGDFPAESVVITAASIAEGISVPADRPQRVSDGQTYFEFQVEKAVSPAAGGTVSPRYPDVLRSAGIEGEVLAQFIVDENGQVVPGTFKALKSTHDLFTAAVMNALPQMNFNSAKVGDKSVKQLVQMPFQFNLSKGTSAGVPTPPPAR